jgi:hypothetical protein
MDGVKNLLLNLSYLETGATSDDGIVFRCMLRSLSADVGAFDPPPEPGFARREAHYDRNAEAETAAAGS